MHGVDTVVGQCLRSIGAPIRARREVGGLRPSSPSRLDQDDRLQPGMGQADPNEVLPKSQTDHRDDHPAHANVTSSSSPVKKATVPVAKLPR